MTNDISESNSFSNIKASYYNNKWGEQLQVLLKSSARCVLFIISMESLKGGGFTRKKVMDIRGDINGWGMYGPYISVYDCTLVGLALYEYML